MRVKVGPAADSMRYRAMPAKETIGQLSPAVTHSFYSVSLHTDGSERFNRVDDHFSNTAQVLLVLLVLILFHQQNSK